MLKFYNTLTKKVEDFVPINQDRITMYVCGPTVYNYPHIGNARPAVIFDVLYRLLKSVFPNVIYARNITDVDDKINTAATELGIPISDLTDKYTKANESDLESLGVLRPDIEPKVTEHISEIINMIERLINLKYAYENKGHVLFNVTSFPKYGLLSKLKQQDLIAGARIEVAPYKKNPADFILWKPSSKETPGWNSPWGRGRPGWHIECSAMIEKHLGYVIDIHGGGQDLIFPHHENEMAQGMCVHGTNEYSRTWIHNGFVTVEGRKMSKSLNNVVIVNEILKKFPGESIRLALLTAHYRQPLDWNSNTLIQAKKTLDNLYDILQENLDIEPKPSEETLVEKHLKEDINTPAALSELYILAKKLHASSDQNVKSKLKGNILRASSFLGLLNQNPSDWFSELTTRNIDSEMINKLIEKRTAARSSKNFEKADEIRRQLIEKGIHIEDTAEGTKWRTIK
tara:strand:- start:2726 stop:4096 length:1371 start_codon:yes stop_codon:yes gene_type:complete